MAIVRSTWVDGVTVINNGQWQTIYDQIDRNPAPVFWAPALIGAGGQSGQGYITAGGLYTVLGKQVVFSGQISLYALGTLTGTVNIVGPPTIGTAIWNGACAIGYWGGMTSSFYSLNAYIAGGTNTLIVLNGTKTAYTGGNLLVQGDFSNTTNIVFSGSYLTV